MRHYAFFISEWANTFFVSYSVLFALQVVESQHWQLYCINGWYLRETRQDFQKSGYPPLFSKFKFFW